MTGLHSLLAQALTREQPSHAYILSGSGNFEQALMFAMALNCLSPLEGGESCGECSSCRKLARQAHPDLFVVEPEGNYLRIEQLRKLQAKAHFEKYEGRYKIFIIKDSEAMKDEAANSILKLLEEPPPATVFLLLAENADKLLPTILSRCQVVNIGGAGGFAVSEEKLADCLPEAEQFLSALPKKQLYQVLLMTNRLEGDRDYTLHFVAACLHVLHSSLKGRFDGETAVLLPNQPKTLLKAANIAEETLGLIRRNINLKLLLDVLFLKLWACLKQA